MSASLGLAAALEAASLIGFATGSNYAIGPIIPGIVVQEDHEDTLTITGHPVEQGAQVTDHSFVNPCSIVIQCLWSNTQAGLFDFSESYCIAVYQQLLNLQKSRQPVTIITTKRLYINMLISAITTSTNKETAYSLPVSLQCEQIIIVQTGATTLPPQDQHITPQQTAPVIDNGSQNLTTAAPNASYLSQIQTAIAAAAKAGS